MSRYIDADALKQEFTCEGEEWICNIIDNEPTIDIEPKRGEWIDKGWHGDWQYETDGRGNCWHLWECSACNNTNIGKTKFCPNCGADMRAEQTERSE